MADTPKDDRYKVTSLLALHESEDANLLIQSHEAVAEFHDPHMGKREECHNFLAGEQWTDEDRERAEEKGKALIEFNKLKTSERTFIGSMIQQRYDVKPAPREPTDQNRADIYTHLYTWQGDLAGIRYKDPALIRDAWAGGNGWQESYMEVVPGRKPRLIVTNQNPFAIYPDPNRRDLVDNSDCEFIDRVSWLSREQLCDACPDKEEMILAALPDLQSVTYDKDRVHADRAHEWKNARNGKYKVIERFYKVRRKLYFAATPGGRQDVGYDMDAKSRTEYKEDFPEHTLHMEREEWLFLAIAVPAIGGEYLYNGPHTEQPRNPATGKIEFTLVELVDEDLDGKVSGHVAPQIGPIKVVNSLMVNELYAAKNAAGQSHVVESEAFEPDELEDLAENHQDGARTFVKKAGTKVQGSGVYLIEQGRPAANNNNAINFAAAFAEEVSSTPPAMKGEAEGNVPGVLNEQRIQQSYVQNQNFNNNYMGFLTRRARLWKYYWKKYMTGQEVLRVLEKKDENDPDWIIINQIVEDEFGNVTRKNTLEDADLYDMTFEDSWKSPTVRDKVRQQIIQLKNDGATAQDPILNAFLTYYFLKLSDAPEDLKKGVREHSQVIRAQEAEKRSQEQFQGEMDMASQLQDMASKEAQASVPQPPAQPTRPGRAPARRTLEAAVA